LLINGIAARCWRATILLKERDDELLRNRHAANSGSDTMAGSHTLLRDECGDPGLTLEEENTSLQQVVLAIRSANKDIKRERAIQAKLEEATQELENVK
jgi:hypothetical protein